MKKKPPEKKKKKPLAPKPAPDASASEKNAERRVAVLRNRLTQAMEDPLMRDQIVRAIRTMMTEER